jgi:hypothetical protein
MVFPLECGNTAAEFFEAKLGNATRELRPFLVERNQESGGQLPVRRHGGGPTRGRPEELKFVITPAGISTEKSQVHGASWRTSPLLVARK